MAMRIIRGERPSIPHIPDRISEELASVLPLWWENDPSRRATSQDVIAFFEHPTVLVSSSDTPKRVATWQTPNNQFHQYKIPPRLVKLLCSMFEDESEGLKLWAARDFQAYDTYPGHPVHILFDECVYILDVIKLY